MNFTLGLFGRKRVTFSTTGEYRYVSKMNLFLAISASAKTYLPIFNNICNAWSHLNRQPLYVIFAIFWRTIYFEKKNFLNSYIYVMFTYLL